jgi:hypothetical protein
MDLSRHCNLCPAHRAAADRVSSAEGDATKLLGVLDEKFTGTFWYFFLLVTGLVRTVNREQNDIKDGCSSHYTSGCIARPPSVR